MWKYNEKYQDIELWLREYYEFTKEWESKIQLDSIEYQLEKETRVWFVETL
jgi:hypothetical protein